jgi:hypothetical protein
MAWWAGNKRRVTLRNSVFHGIRGSLPTGGRGRGEQMRDTIVFDLDGTLADTAGDLIAAANAAMAALGHAPALRPGDDDATAFRGGRAMLELGGTAAGLPDGTQVVEAGYPILLEAYGQAIDVTTRRCIPASWRRSNGCARAGRRRRSAPTSPRGWPST